MRTAARRILRQVPNALTMLRVLLAALFPSIPRDWRLAVALAALATEYLDGAISRRFELETRLGRLLDPVADKLFFASVALTLLAEDSLDAWELALLALRDLGVLFALGWLVARRQWKRLAGLGPGLAGKLTTVLQYAALLSLLLRGRVHPVLVLTTAIAGASAIARYSRHLRPRGGSAEVPS